MNESSNMEHPNKIRPGIVLANEETYYPTGAEWILAFALHGCQWAIDLLESEEMELARRRAADPIETMWGTF